MRIRTENYELRIMEEVPVARVHSLGPLSQTLSHFESAIALKQDLDISYDLAARAAFMVGDESKGKRYAKNAKSLGCPNAFEMWKKGEFRHKC